MARALGLALLAVAAVGCGQVPREPLRLEGGMLTVENQTSDDWHGVEIWLNRYFRVTAPSIAAGSRFQVRLDSFVSGYGQRFDARRTVDDLRLMAKTPDGSPVVLTKDRVAGGRTPLGGKQ